ncbi:uncharacterized protein [Parasteatoda tepidariorum]|uniref:uncharacterized protein n=1 Tax=Parasteatoda tepidariorum TaxID=114398 RepID=UPI0039BC2523
MEVFSKESAYVYSINKDVEVGREEDPHFFPVYPRITICRRPSYKTGINGSDLELFEYALLALGYPFKSLTPKESALLVENAVTRNNIFFKLAFPEKKAFGEKLKEVDERYKKLKKSIANFDLRHFIIENSASCQEIFVECTATVAEIECCEVFKPVLTNLGLCYTLEENFEIVNTEEKLSSSVLMLELNSPPTTNYLQTKNTDMEC